MGEGQENNNRREMQMADDDHELRLARFKLKQANRTMGRQGETIHQLRGELAEIRELNSKVERGQIRSLEREAANLKADLAALSAENEKLRAEPKGLQWPEVEPESEKEEQPEGVT